MTDSPWGDKPIREMTQAEFERKHRETAHAAALAENRRREQEALNRRLIDEGGQI